MRTPGRVRPRWTKGTWMTPRHDIIREVLRLSDYSYEDVAALIGCSKAMVGHLARRPERGKGAQTCSPELAQKLAVLLGVPANALFEVHLPTSTSEYANQNRRAA